jgi:hypothetical protein
MLPAACRPARGRCSLGGGRTYEYVVGAVTSTDGMIADFYSFDMKFLGETATRIINEVKGVNRVMYDVTSKPPGDDRVGVRLSIRAWIHLCAYLNFALDAVVVVAENAANPSRKTIKHGQSRSS